MKTKIFLVMGLMASMYGYGQNTYAAPTGTGGAGTAGADNVHLGYGAGAVSGISTDRNVFVGYNAGTANSTGEFNTFLGGESGFSNSVGMSNVFLGNNSGYSNTEGQRNVFVGNGSGFNNLIGGYNVYMGYRAGYNPTDITNNVGIGAWAGTLATGDNNVYIGFQSGQNADGFNNILIGETAGGVISGSNTVAIGKNAGNASTGDSVFIGHQAGQAETGSDKLYIANTNTADPLIYGEFDNKILRLNANRVGIGDAFGTGDFNTDLVNEADYRLFVKGNILAEEVRIRKFPDWADYVFSPDYNLLSLQDTEKFIAKNGHLPNMPSAAEVKEQGLEMGNIIKLQQEKIEELTLHLIRHEREIEELKENNKQLEELKAQVEILIKRQ